LFDECSGWLHVLLTKDTRPVNCICVFMHRLSVFLFSLTGLLLFSCQEITDVDIPSQDWSEFQSATAKALLPQHRARLEGVYLVTEAAYPFGDTLAGKWSYTVNGRDTTWHFSLFGEEEASVFICEGKTKNDSLLLNGYWRKMVNTQVGRVRFKFSASDTTKNLSGWFGDGDEVPAQAIHLRYLRPLYNRDSLIIIGHRGGGRNNDLLPASENSVEMLKLAARLGATGVEIDVQLTKDSVPVLYHDDKINDRLTEKAGIHGSINEYTLAELKVIDLKRGGRIPTLQQALDTILYKTPLQYVWLDCKGGNLRAVNALQMQYMQKAKAAGRKLVIAIGIPDEDVMKQFTALPSYKAIPSLTELDTSFARKLHVNAWAPSWLKGLQLPEVIALKKQGIGSIVWTLDMHDKIEEFVRHGAFAGICSNRPGVVAHYRYVR
jgi:glycerophosphoryl diester phosphodiesterase